MSSNDNAKVSDSGYTNTYGNSQSQRSSGSSQSRNSNRSESSGYCGGQPSTFGSSNDAPPQPITKKKDKEHEKKKSKTTLDNNLLETAQVCASQQLETGSYTVVSGTGEQSEVEKVELMDATNPTEHNNTSRSTVSDGGLDTNKKSPTNDFYTVMSLQDGIVLYSTVSPQSSLGYPKDSWIGKSFIDYVDPKDKRYFADKLIDNIDLPFDDQEKDLSRQTASLFCRFLTYTGNEKNDNSMKSESEKLEQQCQKLNDKNNEPVYIAFRLNLGFKYFGEKGNKDNPLIMLVTILASPVLSFYKAPEETIVSTVFSTRHTATCHLSHIDDNAVQYFGYLPQDMIGRSLFDFYHPEDLPFIKDVYETVIRLQGSSFRSKPYRFASQNGGYIVLETKWSSFINPWTEKLEFVIGYHRVLRGPINPNVFDPPDDYQYSIIANIGEEIIKQSQIIKGEIHALLNEKIKKSTIIKYNKPNDLAEFMDNLGQEIERSCIASNYPINIPTDIKSFSEHDSVMMGEISPHHEYCDSKSSSETPPSYNQLNYNEKIERFFNSNLLINTNYGTDEENINSTGQNNYGIDKISPNNSSSKCTTQNHDSGGSGSGENFSNESNNKTSTLSGDTSPINGNLYTTKQDKFKLPTLTKTLLTKHNQDMEKLMMLQHKEKRSNIKNNKLNEDARIKNLNDKLTRQKKSTGKKANKRRHNLNNKNDTPGKISKLNDGTKKPEKIESKNTRQFDKLNQVTEMNTNNNSVPANSTSQETLCSVVPSMLPIYYFPVLNIKENHMTMLVAPQPITNQLPTGQFDCPNSIASHAAPVTKLTNPQIIGAPGLASMLFTPSIVIKIPSVQENLENKNEKSAESKGPESQATSIKAQPGSIMATSESSKKILSIGGHISSCVSVEGGCSSIVDQQSSMNTQKKPESSVQDSSDSSFYGRYLDSSSESSSMENHKANLTRLSEEISNKRGRHFSMINDMKANFELQTNIQPVEATQKLLIERNRLKNKKNKQKIIKMTPPWLEGVNMTPDLIYKYQLTPKPLNNVLEADMIALKNFEQPQLVNEQLEQLYIDLELNKFETRLIIEDSNPSSVSIDQQLDSIYPDTKEELTPQQKSARREMKHATMSMIYEENAPFPTD